jgi:hypothetical protein
MGSGGFSFFDLRMGRNSVSQTAQVAMPFRGPTPEDLDRIVDQLLPLVADDPNSPLAKPLGMTFDQIERTATRIGQRLIARLTERTLEQHADASQSATPEVACPKCALLCRLTRKKRRITTVAGVLEYREPASHCVDCRRDFFPDTPVAATR